MERFQGFGDIGGEFLEKTQGFYIEISAVPVEFPRVRSLGANPAIKQLL
jgi:hypothetical protein